MIKVTITQEEITRLNEELAGEFEATAEERKVKALQRELDRLESLSGTDALEISRQDGWFYISRADGTGTYARVPDRGTSTHDLLHRPFYDFHEIIAARKRTIRAELGEANNLRQHP